MLVASWQVGYAGLVPDEVLAGLDARERADAWRARLDDADVLVAEAGGELAGFASLAVPARDLDEPEIGEVTALYVEPGHWRRGIGRALIDASAAELREQGCDAAVVWAFEAGERARGFYAALGFAPDGGSGTHERTGLPVLRLRAPLRR